MSDLSTMNTTMEVWMLLRKLLNKFIQLDCFLVSVCGRIQWWYLSIS